MIRNHQPSVRNKNPVSKSLVRKHSHGTGLFAGIVLACLLTACDSTVNLTPTQHLDKARSFIAENNLNAAIIEIKNAIQKDADLPESRLLLGNVYLQLGSGASAERELINARTLGYEDDGALEKALLQSYLLQQKYQDIISSSADQADTNALPADILVIRGDAFLGLGQQADAVSSYTRALVTDNSSVDARLSLARIAMADNRRDEARRLLEEARTLDADDINVWTLTGRLELIENNLEAAEQAYTKAVEIADYNTVAQFGLIRSLLAQKKYEQARAPLDHMTALYPEHPIGKYFMAVFALHENNVEEARTRLLEVLKVLPNHAESQLMMAQLTYNERQLEQSREFLQAFLAQYPDNVDALKMLAVVQTQLNEPDAAISTIEGIMSADGKDPQTLALLATANIQAGRTSLGTDLLEDALELAPDNTVIRTQLATAYLNQGANDKAITELEQAVRDAPQFMESRVLLITGHLRKGDFDAAIKSATELTEAEPESAVAFNLLGSVYSSSGNTEMAKQQFTRAMSLDPKFIPARFNLGRLEYSQGNVDAAGKLYLEILDIDANHPGTLLELARLESGRGNIDAMVARLEQARAGNPGAAAPRIMLGRHYLRTGDTTKLLEVATEAARLDPSSPDARLLLGQAQRLNGMAADSLRTLTSLNTSNPGSTPVLYELALTSLQTAENDAAKTFLNEVLRLSPDHIGALRARIDLAIRQGEPEVARSYTARLQELQPDSPAVTTLMGDIFYSESRFDEAVAAYEQAYEISRTIVLAGKLGQAYQKSGETAKALSILDEWSVEHPDDIRVDMLLANTHLQANNTGDAIRLYEKILTRDPDNIIALNNLSWLYIDSNISRAQELAERANSIAPQQTEIIDTLGWILTKQGKSEQGLNLLRRALILQPDSADIRYHFAYALAQTGEVQQARDELRSILEANRDFPEMANAEKLYNSLK